MKKKNILIIIAIIFIISLVSFFTFNYISKNKASKSVEVIASIQEKQKEIESNFKIDGYTFDKPNVILNPYGNSPLTALVIFETKENIAPAVTIEGKDKNSTFNHQFKSGTKHYLPIYGLYGGKDNKVTISYKLNGRTYNKELIITTKELPKNIILPKKVYANKTKLGNDLYFYTPSSPAPTCAYDVNGDIRWYFTERATWRIDRIKNGHIILSTNRIVNPPYYTSGMFEYDLLGKVYNEYSLPGGYHHDYFEMDNGNFLVATNDFNNDYGTVEDVIVELDRKTGDIVKTIDLKDILTMTDAKSENWSDYDWFHNNAIWYDKKTNSITLSGRHQDAVINLDYKTGKLNWIIGDPTGWSKEYQKYFFKPIGKNFEWQWSQHAAMITPEGYVFVLDNGNNKSKNKKEYVPAEKSYTRGVMYKIDTDKMTIEQIWQYGKERGSKFYSPYISDVDYLSSNHKIVHSGGIVYVDGKVSNQPAGFSKNTTLTSDTVELLNDKIVFELVLPTNNYRVEKMPMYAKDENFTIVEGKSLGTLGVTDKKETKSNLFLKTNKIDDEYKSHNITIKQESDRLTLKGQFKRDTKVNIILSKGFTANVYEYRISKKPYTALCVDIFTEEENEKGIIVNKYINKDGLKGKYKIYIEIEDKIYDIDSYVDFK